MCKHYPVVDVKQSWMVRIEEMGSRDKFWYQASTNGPEWLFKSPRDGTGEHWAEKISSEVAALLGIDHATTELATFHGKRGSVSKSFIGAGGRLTHGNQLLEREFEGYDGKKRYDQSDHFLDNIWETIEKVFKDSQHIKDAKLRISECLVLDAVIGNTDRHHENWGVLVRRVNDHSEEIIAPSYDHASALGRELLDVKRDSLLATGGVGRYVERGHGGVYWTRDSSSAPSPLELVRRAVRAYPEDLLPAIDRVKVLNEIAATELVSRVPSDWMTGTARELATAMICYSVMELRKLL